MSENGTKSRLLSDQPVVSIPDPEQSPLSNQEYEEEIHRRLKEEGARIRATHDTQLGFPLNFNSASSSLNYIHSDMIINVGNPFVKWLGQVTVHGFELGVLEWFASLWEIEMSQCWGYLASGGTEATMYGLFKAREELPDGIMYVSADGHYSVHKVAQLLRIQVCEVASLANGEIDYKELEEKLVFNSAKPAIVLANIGSTMKQAIDNIDRIVDSLHGAGFTSNRYRIHCDAALSGVMLPFVQHPCMLSFKKPISSISVSGHKFLGCPYPCGIVIARGNPSDFQTDAEISMSLDTTIGGCRNGHSALYLWYLIATKGKKGIEKEVNKCIEMAQELERIITEKGEKCYRNEFSNTVVFARPNDAMVRKYHLACERDLAHAVAMPHANMQMIEQFAKELLASRLTT